MEVSSLEQQKYLDPSQITSKISMEEQQSITCMICLGVVIQPAECKSCETVYCSKQVMKQGSYKPCPICKSISWKFGSEIHKSYKSKLTSLVIKCDQHPACKDIEYTYEKYLNHFNGSKLDKSVQKGYYQFYYKNEGNWEHYQQCLNSACNVYLQDGIAQFTVCGYLIKINEKIQINIKTKLSREIKMELNKKRIPQPLWVAQVETGKYEPYGSHINAEIESTYKQFLNTKRKQTVIQVGRYYYNINYQLMTQMNTISKTSRRIKRIMI